MYCTVDDIITELTESVAAQLSNENNTTHVDRSYIEGKITEATSYIDSFINGIYELPLSTNNVVIKRECIKLTIYFLKQSRARNHNDGFALKEIDDRLTNIANSKITLIGEKKLNRYLVKTTDPVYD